MAIINLTVAFLFVLSSLLIMLGIYLNSKFLLKGKERNILFKKFFAIFIKYLGFTLLGYLIYNQDFEGLFIYLSIFVASYIFSFLLLLLARKVALM